MTEHYDEAEAYRNRAERAEQEAAELREDAQRLIDALGPVFARFREGENAPGHSHLVPGIWDDNNRSRFAGTPCEWCAQWNAALAALRRGIEIGRAG